MYRNGIPLIPIEELGYHLGLTVNTKDAPLFYKARSSDYPPVISGFGTRILEPEYEPNKVFQRLKIPLEFTLVDAIDIPSVEGLKQTLSDIEIKDHDAMLCFNHGVLKGKYQPFSGHVVVFDRIIEDEIRIVDVSPNYPKWRMVDAEVMFDAIRQHKDAGGGIWIFSKV